MTSSPVNKNKPEPKSVTDVFKSVELSEHKKSNLHIFKSKAEQKAYDQSVSGRLSGHSKSTHTDRDKEEGKSASPIPCKSELDFSLREGVSLKSIEDTCFIVRKSFSGK